MAALPHGRTLSGGSALPLDPSHFRGEAGLDLLAGMIRAYFHMGGAQLHLVLADRKTLQTRSTIPSATRISWYG